MLRASSVAARAGARDQLEMEKLVSHLQSLGYTPVIRSILAGGCATLGLPGPNEQRIADAFGRQARQFQYRTRGSPSGVVGEVLLREGTMCIVYPHRSEMLRVSVVGHGHQDDALRLFCEDVEAAVRARFDGRRVRGMDFAWKSLSPRMVLDEVRSSFDRFDPFLAVPGRQEGRFQLTDPDYTAEDLECCRLLVGDSARSFILTLAKLGKMRSEDAVADAGKDVVDQLVSGGLLAQEYLLTCKRDRHTICVTPSRDDITKEPTASLQCSGCGRAFRDENVQEIHSLTGRAKRLLDGSLWMHVWVTELLVENGVSRESIKWSLEAQGEELDLMVEDFDSRLFFELKDREFGLGDAYPFSYRLSRYGGRLGVVATMDQVSSDAKAFFDEQVRRGDAVPQIRCLEAAGGIREGVRNLVKELSLSQVQRLLGPLSERLGFDLWVLIEPRMALEREAGPAAASAGV